MTASRWNEIGLLRLAGADADAEGVEMRDTFLCEQTLVFEVGSALEQEPVGSRFPSLHQGSRSTASNSRTNAIELIPEPSQAREAGHEVRLSK